MSKIAKAEIKYQYVMDLSGWLTQVEGDVEGVISIMPHKVFLTSPACKEQSSAPNVGRVFLAVALTEN